MAPQEAQRIVRRFLEEAWNKGNLDVVDELIASEYRLHATVPLLPLFGGPVLLEGTVLTPTERIKQSILLRRAAFPDWRASVERMVVEGDTVATLQRGTGSHLGEYLGVPPTGKTATMTSMSIRRISGGMIVEEWLVIDAADFVHQLGLLSEVAGQERTAIG